MDTEKHPDRAWLGVGGQVVSIPTVSDAHLYLAQAPGPSLSDHLGRATPNLGLRCQKRLLRKLARSWRPFASLSLSLLSSLLGNALCGAEDSTPPPTWWSIDRSPETIMSDISTDAGAALHIDAGRVAISVRPDPDRPPLVVTAGPLILEVAAGMVLVECLGQEAFVVALAGQVEVHSGGGDSRGVLLQSRQGIAVHGDHELADVLTFERLPHLDDPLPLVDQATLEDDGTSWPTMEQILIVAAPVIEVIANQDSVSDPIVSDVALQMDDDAFTMEDTEFTAAPTPPALAERSPITSESAATLDTPASAAPVENSRPSRHFMQIPWQHRGRR
jgi:hypothetical protein